MRIQIITLFMAALSTGIMSGIFFTWTNAVTPGIGKLTDTGYLNALQSMNRVILNPAFFLVFWGAVVFIPAAAAFSYNSDSNTIFWLLISAAVIYWLGAFFVTFFGNIPLNNLLDKTNLEEISLNDANNLRRRIEIRWNNLNLVRTITSAVSFILLIISSLLINK